MLTWWRRRRRQRRLERLDTSPLAWAEAWSDLPVLEGLDEDAGARLRRIAALLLDEKTWSPAAGSAMPPGAARTIALLAALPVLELGVEWLDDFATIIVYPDSFIAEFDDHDEATGVVHRIREARSGESWHRGPLVLSWADVQASRELDGFNVVLHEVAHKLDGADGDINGKPPLHRDMGVRAWSEAFLAAYELLLDDVEADRPTAIDPYAAQAPEEFFAVATEAFFETPHDLLDAYPEVYSQLAAFYRQDPVRRLRAPYPTGQPAP
ncbi:MAG: M90 family metallopeptidase [Gammaproteobacteria bacterium]|nr:M90 family metallopeptidase [Gammaproteobacteria bacterium]